MGYEQEGQSTQPCGHSLRQRFSAGNPYAGKTGRHLERAGKASVGYSLRERLRASNPALSVEVGLHFWVIDGSVVDSSIELAENACHTSGYVRMRQHTSAYVCC